MDGVTFEVVTGSLSRGRLYYASVCSAFIPRSSSAPARESKPVAGGMVQINNLVHFKLS